MKKSLLILTALFGMASISNAQEETYKPVTGMTSLELTFNPSAIFNASNTGNMFGLSSIGGLNQGVKYRNWMSESVAYRGTFLLGLKNSSVPFTVQNSAGDDVDVKDSYFEWAIQIRPGVERHFSGTKRLSPYVGSELIIGYGSNTYKHERLDATDAIVEDVRKNDATQAAWTYANGFTGGLGLIAGFDYYIAKDLYLGLEMNYAFIFNQANKIKTEINGQDPVETKQGSNWYFNPSTGANLKLGWNF
jgi:hypothetical protein